MKSGAKKGMINPIRRLFSICIVAAMCLTVFIIEISPEAKGAAIDNGFIHIETGPNLDSDNRDAWGPGIIDLWYSDWYGNVGSGNEHDEMWYGQYDYVGIADAGTMTLNDWKNPDVPADGTSTPVLTNIWADDHDNTPLSGGTVNLIDANTLSITWDRTHNGVSVTVTETMYAIPGQRTIRVTYQLTNNDGVAHDFAMYHADDFCAGDWPTANNDFNGDGNDDIDDDPGTISAGDPDDAWDDVAIEYTGSNWYSNWPAGAVKNSGWQGAADGFITVINADGKDSFDQTVAPAVPGSDGRPDDYVSIICTQPDTDWYVGRWYNGMWGPGIHSTKQYGFPPRPKDVYYSWEDIIINDEIYGDSPNHDLEGHDIAIGMLHHLGTVGPGETTSFDFFIGEPPSGKDLVIQSNDITIEPDFGSAWEGSIQYINVSVWNTGMDDVTTDFNVDFYVGGDPDTDDDGIIDSGTFLGSVVLTNSPADPLVSMSSKTASFLWDTTGYAGIHDIWVVVDYPADNDGSVDEIDTVFNEILNNQAKYDTSSLTTGPSPPFVTVPPDYQVLPLPDLEITSPDIIFNPVSPQSAGTLVDISAAVHNIGGTDITNDILVEFWLGVPDLEPDGIYDGTGIKIGEATIVGGISAAGTQLASCSTPWDTTGLSGSQEIWVTVDYPADKGGVISPEIEEISNNIAMAIFEIVSEPLPPVNLTIEAVGDDILLDWDLPISPDTDYFLIYGGPSRTAIDLYNPLGSTALTDWTHSGVNNPLDVNYLDEFYYVVRTVDTGGAISFTSNTVGKIDRDFPAQTSTFSLPLEPSYQRNASWYIQQIGSSPSDYIKWWDPMTQQWVMHSFADGNGVNDNVVNLGEGYEIFLDSPKTFTFCGKPASSIRYIEGEMPAPGNFIVTVNTNGDVTLSWDVVPSADHYIIYRVQIREGLNDPALPFAVEIPFGTNTWTDPDPQTNIGGNQFYYTVGAVNLSSVHRTFNTSYSIGLWFSDFPGGYSSVGMPLKTFDFDTKTIDQYCDDIPNIVGMNYYLLGEQRWSWHRYNMPKGAYDDVMGYMRGYQLSTFNSAKYGFVGR